MKQDLNHIDNKAILRIKLFLLIVLIIGFITFPNHSYSKSSRFDFHEKTLGYKPIAKVNFLRKIKIDIKDQICTYAESLDSECASIAHPPCQKLIPIAYNYCSAEYYRQMHPQITSNTEDIFWSNKFTYCVKAATKALVTNIDRQNLYCRDEEEDEDINEEYDVEDDFFN